MKKKVIIIGAGFAGLSAAAFMAKAGWQVIVIDKNPTAGGRACQLKAEGFTFDMGPSWYWMPDVFENFFASFGKKVSDYYSLKRLDPSYRVYWKDEALDIPADLDELKDLFESIEKGAGSKLDKYLAEAAVKYRISMTDMVFRPGRSILEFLDWKVMKNVFFMNLFRSIKSHVAKHFKDPRLQQIMEFPVLFLGALPEKTPALYSLMNYADIVGGTWYPDGGMFSVVKGMQKLGEELGVQFVFGDEAKEILIEKGRAKRLVTTKNSYEADAIISGADYHFTEFNLLPAAYRSYSESYWDKRTLSPSCLIYFVGLNTRLRNILHHSLFFDVPFQAHADNIYSDPQWPEDPLFYMSATSQSDITVAPAGSENLFILIPIASGLEGDTEELREKYFKQVVGRIEKQTGQLIQEHIVFKKSYSVSDFTADYNSYKGNAYGLANLLSQTAVLRPSCQSKKVENLFYAGQFTVPGPGVPPSLISGEIVSRQLLKTFKHQV